MAPKKVLSGAEKEERRIEKNLKAKEKRDHDAACGSAADRLAECMRATMLAQGTLRNDMEDVSADIGHRA